MAKPKKKEGYEVATVKLRPGLKDKVKKKAAKANTTLSEIVDILLYDYATR